MISAQPPNKADRFYPSNSTLSAPLKTVGTDFCNMKNGTLWDAGDSFNSSTMLAPGITGSQDIPPYVYVQNYGTESYKLDFFNCVSWFNEIVDDCEWWNGTAMLTGGGWLEVTESKMLVLLQPWWDLPADLPSEFQPAKRDTAPVPAVEEFARALEIGDFQLHCCCSANVW